MTTCRRLPLAIALFGALLASAGAVRSAEPALAESIPELETFVVTGEQPGPALWKVTYQDHTLWILPTLGPLPDRLVWKSAQVETVIGESQVVYAETRIPLQRPTDLKSQQRAMKAISNPDGKPLSAVMPAALYKQFSDLNRRYAGNNGMLESFRPFQATDMLKDSAMAQLSLTSDGGVHDRVRELARKYRVEYLEFEELDTRAWNTMISQLERTPREADLACTKARLDRLESDLREAVERSNAWARGDIETLRQDAGLRADGVDLDVCRQFFQHMKFVRETVATVRRKSHSAYERALKENSSTLAVVSIRDMFGPEGLITRFRKKGYGIEEP